MRQINTQPGEEGLIPVSYSHNSTKKTGDRCVNEAQVWWWSIMIQNWERRKHHQTESKIRCVIDKQREQVNTSASRVIKKLLVLSFGQFLFKAHVMNFCNILVTSGNIEQHLLSESHAVYSQSHPLEVNSDLRPFAIRLPLFLQFSCVIKAKTKL